MTVDFSPTQPIFSSTSTTIFILFSTILGLVLVYLGFTIPFCTWLLMGYFLSFPTESDSQKLFQLP